MLTKNTVVAVLHLGVTPETAVWLLSASVVVFGLWNLRQVLMIPLWCRNLASDSMTLAVATFGRGWFASLIVMTLGRCTYDVWFSTMPLVLSLLMLTVTMLSVLMRGARELALM